MPFLGASDGVMSIMLGAGLGAQFLATAGAARVQNFTSGLGCHAGAEPVATFANQVRGLKGAFHRSVSSITVGYGADSPPVIFDKNGSLSGPDRQVKPCDTPNRTELQHFLSRPREIVLSYPVDGSILTKSPALIKAA